VSKTVDDSPLTASNSSDIPETPAQILALQRKLNRGFQEAEFVASIVRRPS
jgi:hypothetical protein